MAKATKKAAELFDLEAMEAEIAAIKEKHLGGAKTKLEELKVQRYDLQTEISNLETLLGISHPKIGEAKAKGTRTRMSAEDKAAHTAAALAFIKSKKDGASRGDIAKALGLEGAQIGTILAAIKGNGAEPKGEKSLARWFAK